MVARATLIYAIFLTRIFSVTSGYYFAFLAVSVAIFGMTVDAIMVHRLPDDLHHRVTEEFDWKNIAKLYLELFESLV